MELTPPWADSTPNDIVHEDYQAAVALMALKYTVSDAPPLNLSPYPESAIRSTLQPPTNDEDDQKPMYSSAVQQTQTLDLKVIRDFRDDQNYQETGKSGLDTNDLREIKIDDNSDSGDDYDNSDNDVKVSNTLQFPIIDEAASKEEICTGEKFIPKEEEEQQLSPKTSRFTPINSRSASASGFSDKSSVTSDSKESAGSSPSQEQNSKENKKYHPIEDTFIIWAREMKQTWEWVRERRRAVLEDFGIFDRPLMRQLSSLRVHFEDLKKKKRNALDMENEEVRKVVACLLRKWPDANQQMKKPLKP